MLRVSCAGTKSSSSLPRCLLTTLTQITSGCALLVLSPSSWVRILRTFHKNKPGSLGHKTFYDIIFCSILFFFLLYMLTHLARTISSSCTCCTQPGQCFRVSDFRSLGWLLIILLSPNAGMFHGSLSKLEHAKWRAQQHIQLVFKGVNCAGQSLSLQVRKNKAASARFSLDHSDHNYQHLQGTWLLFHRACRVKDYI